MASKEAYGFFEGATIRDRAQSTAKSFQIHASLNKVLRNFENATISIMLVLFSPRILAYISGLFDSGLAGANLM